MKKLLLLLCVFLALSRSAMPDASHTKALSLNAYLQLVLESNLSYAAERYNVSMADAQIAAARQIPNPTLGYGFSRDVTYAASQRLQSNTVGNINQLFELGGKRKRRTDVATKSRAAASATLDGFLNQLRSDASTAFVDALSQRRLAEKSREIAADINQLAKAQAERFKAGQIGEADVLQTEIEAEQFQTSLINIQAQADSAVQTMGGFLGVEGAWLRVIPLGDLEQSGRTFDVVALTSHALKERQDLVALRHLADAAQSRISLEKANRVPDLSVGLGVSQLSSTQNVIAPTPANNSLVISFSFPLPIWNQNKAAIQNAQFAALQAQKQVEAAELSVKVEVQKAFTLYRAAVSSVDRYRNGILKKANLVLEARRTSYQKGQATLLELLIAQRTAQEVRTSYEAVLATQAKALVELQRVSSRWDVRF
ncbi:TolC family protein [Prosthecobacter sp.]|uniref:TolC family protein n=1 Tax=Prosthecobacter sp. TaxID=1965333 RepID=UPI003783F948